MSPAQEQFARMKRYLARMDRKAISEEGADDMYSFFLHAWHLLDWASNDPAVGRKYKKLKKEVRVKFPNSIWRCADIADGSKHLLLTRPKHRPVPQAFKDHRVGGGRPSEVTFRFKFPDGMIKDALTLAREVVADWEQFLKRYGIAL